MAKAKRRERMTEESLTAIVRGLLKDAKDYSEEIGEKRSKATAAYNGDEYGNEEEGRSQIVTREVRDAVRMAMPSVMRTLFGSHSQLEFEPVNEEDIPHARDATNYVLHAIRKDGYMEYYSASQDALIRKTGIFKAWWDTSTKIVRTEHTGLSEEQLEILAADPAVIEVDAEETTAEVPGPDGQMVAIPTFDASVIRRENKSGRLRFVAVPPEEFVISRDARNIDDATLVGHVRNITKSDLRSMGYSADVVDELSGTDEDLDDEEETRSVGNTTDPSHDNIDPSQQEVMFAELWVKVDFDSDGIAELRRICVAGSGCTILENEITDIAMMADLCPSPVAHQAIGDSLAELVEDIQKIKSMTMRNVMDSMAQAIHPDVVGVENEVNFDDLLNPEMGRVIRARRPGMVEYMSAPFLGKEAFPVLQYLDQMGESRTGMNQASQGLNADALQSTAKSAIDNATQAAQAQIELIVRTFMEGGIKRLYKLLLKLTVENADRATKLRLNNRFTEIDPRSWNADMDVTINAALGQGSVDQRMAVLSTLAAKQELIIQTAGPENPICTVQEYRNTLAEMARLGGIVDVESYFKNPENEPPQPPPQPQPDPQLMLAQSEVERARNETRLKYMQLELDAWKAMQENDRKRDEAMAKILLEVEKLQAEGKKIEADQIRQEVDKARQGDDMLFKLLQEVTAFQEGEKDRAQQAQQAKQQPRGQ